MEKMDAAPCSILLLLLCGGGANQTISSGLHSHWLVSLVFEVFLDGFAVKGSGPRRYGVLQALWC